jgi:hypothetical protein
MNLRVFINISLILFFSFSFGQSKKLKIYTDERIELLNVIQYLSDYPILNQSENLEYKKEIDHYFKDFKNHNAILLNRKVYKEFLGFDRAVNFILHYDLPKFDLNSEFDSKELENLNALKSKDSLSLIRNEFKDFYEKSNFKQFFENHSKFYKQINKSTKKELNKYNIISILEKHYGLQNNSYSIILAALLHNGGYEVDIQNQKGNNLIAVIGPNYDSINKMPIFDYKSILSEYVIHEFSHSFCNPLIDKYYYKLKECECLLIPIQDKIKAQGYKGWKTCLYEHLVRANEIVINEIVFGKETSDKLYNEMINDGWIYLEGIVPIIKDEYLKNRNKYKTQDEIMGLIINYLEIKKGKCIE